jgi:hypothetical protein
VEHERELARLLELLVHPRVRRHELAADFGTEFRGFLTHGYEFLVDAGKRFPYFGAEFLQFPLQRTHTSLRILRA